MHSTVVDFAYPDCNSLKVVDIDVVDVVVLSDLAEAAVNNPLSIVTLCVDIHFLVPYL